MTVPISPLEESVRGNTPVVCLSSVGELYVMQIKMTRLGTADKLLEEIFCTKLCKAEPNILPGIHLVLSKAGTFVFTFLPQLTLLTHWGLCRSADGKSVVTYPCFTPEYTDATTGKQQKAVLECRVWTPPPNYTFVVGTWRVPNAAITLLLVHKTDRAAPYFRPNIPNIFPKSTICMGDNVWPPATVDYCGPVDKLLNDIIAQMQVSQWNNHLISDKPIGQYPIYLAFNPLTGDQVMTWKDEVSESNLIGSGIFTRVAVPEVDAVHAGLTALAGTGTPKTEETI